MKAENIEMQTTRTFNDDENIRNQGDVLFFDRTTGQLLAEIVCDAQSGLWEAWLYIDSEECEELDIPPRFKTRLHATQFVLKELEQFPGQRKT